MRSWAQELPSHLITSQTSTNRTQTPCPPTRSRQYNRCDAADSRNHLTPHASSCPFHTKKTPPLSLLHYPLTTAMYHLAKSLYFYATSKEGFLTPPPLISFPPALLTPRPAPFFRGPLYISNPPLLYQNKQNTLYSYSA